MNLYVFDTDHVTLHQHNHPQVIAKLQTCAPENVAVTVVTLQEQMRGRLAQIERRGVNLTLAYDQLRATAEYFCGLTVLPFDAEAQLQFQRLRERKIRIGTLDLRIAAIVLSRNAILITRNQRDFERVPGLSTEDWSQ
ncbi:MAG: type II toxin-antitoxin system VapC family toxin [Blastocatellia bacterium]|nr:type II toxin-antitoxin system VapC family toxin [Blastocatellia bacterium]